MSKKTKKLGCLWLSGNYHQVQVAFSKLVAGELYDAKNFPVKIKDPNVLVVDCGYNPPDMDDIYKYTSASDLIILLKNRDIFDDGQRIIKLKGLPPDYTILVDCTSNAVVIGIPSAVGLEGRIFNIKCINSTFQCEIDLEESGETLDATSSNLTLILHETITVQSDGSNWWII